MDRVRAWCFTDFGNGVCWDGQRMAYLIMGNEVCPATGRAHKQGYVYFKHAHTLSALVRKYRGVHFEKTLGSHESNRTYCSKEGDFQEWGEFPSQGTRTDILDITSAVRDGLRDDEILEIFGDKALRIYRAIGWAREALSEIKRDWCMDVRIYWGPSGSGKTRKVWDEFGSDGVYAKMVGKWWDAYRGEDCVLIDDFDPANCFDVQFDFYLKLLDRYPLRIEYKGGSTQFRSRTIIFTSNFNPIGWFRDKPNRAAFFRRVGRIEHIDPDRYENPWIDLTQDLEL